MWHRREVSLDDLFSNVLSFFYISQSGQVRKRDGGDESFILFRLLLMDRFSYPSSRSWLNYLNSLAPCSTWLLYNVCEKCNVSDHQRITCLEPGLARTRSCRSYCATEQHTALRPGLCTFSVQL